MSIPSAWDVEVRRAEKMVAKDRQQRWVYSGPNGVAISESPVPYRDAVSICWMPIVCAVSVNYRPATLAHPAIH